MSISGFYIQELYEAIDAVPQIEKLNNASVLITGATGLIGSYTVELLLAYNRREQANIRVYAMGRSMGRLKERFSQWETPDLFLVEHDVNYPLEIEESFDYIIHAASNAYPAAFDKYPVDTVMSNTMGTYYLLEYARRSNVKRFVFVSSGEVYGISEKPDMVFNELYSGYVNSIDPRACYPNSKRLGETLCVSYVKQYNTSTVIVRPCHVYGPYTTKSDNRASAQFFDNVLHNKDIVLKSLGLQRRSYCYVSDCVSALLTVMLNGEDGQAYNISNSKSVVTIAELAETIAKIGGQRVIMQLDNAPKGVTAPHNQILSCELIESLGWYGRYSIDRGVRHTLHILNDRLVID